MLLVLITGRPVVTKSEEKTHITQWISPQLEMGEGDIENIIDPRLQGNFDTNSIYRALEVGMACASSTSLKRPSMTRSCSNEPPNRLFGSRKKHESKALLHPDRVLTDNTT